MQLTRYTDYGLRTLMVLALEEEGTTVSRIAETYDISRNHLVKVAHHLGRLGFIKTTRGKSGGLKLAMKPEDILLSEVVRSMEPNFNIVECFNEDGSGCRLTPVCGLKGMLAQAERAFMEVLSRYTLADIVANRADLEEILSEQVPVEAEA